MGLAGGLAGVAAGGMDLMMVSVSDVRLKDVVTRSPRVDMTDLIWESLLETSRRSILNRLGDSRVTSGVALALTVLVGRHSCGLRDES